MALTLQTYSTVADAGAALKAPATRYMGGGTLAVRAANEGDLSFSTLIRATDPALSRIEIAGRRATIGAGVTMAAVAAHSGLSTIASAARAVGGPAVRNQASVGGNLFAASPYGDFAVALLALDATVHSASGEMPIDAFLSARDTFTGIVTAVSFDVPRDGRFRFVKVSRVKPKGVSVLSIAAVIEEDGEGRITSARIGLGCMADRPMRARAAEAALVGCTRTAEGIAAALAVVGEGTSPPTDAVASAWYRAEVLPVHLRRLLLA
jgi:CO/xanthine dehydrogenase FAD-binding subunit